MYQPGQVVYTDYGEVPPCVHTRLILGHIRGNDYLIETPDGDRYVEQLDDQNADLTALHIGPDDGSVPPGVAPGTIYAFQPMTVAQLNARLAVGRAEAAQERQRLGIVDPVVAAEDNPWVWVLAEMVSNHKVGERVVPPQGIVRDGDWGLMSIANAEQVARPCLVRRLRENDVPAFCEERVAAARATEALEGEDRYSGEDVRTLEVKYGVGGDRQRSFRETIAEMTQCDFEDFPFEVRTALPYAKAVATVSESAFGQHLGWVAQSKIPDGDRAIHENEVLSRALDLAVCYDSLNIANLASFELLIRRKQLLAEAHSYTPGQPSYEGADHFLGTSYRPGGAIVVPELTKHVAEKMHQESVVLKEKRKQAELKGKGKSKPSNPQKPNPGKGGGELPVRA